MPVEKCHEGRSKVLVGVGTEPLNQRLETAEKCLQSRDFRGFQSFLTSDLTP